ncbi:MAG: flagellin [Pseudomonadota bacterium]
MRVSDLGLQQILFQGFQQAQGAAQTRQIQLSSGDEFQTYGEYGADALRLISAEGVVTRANAFETAASAALTRLETQGVGLELIGEAINELRATFSRTLATGNAELLFPDIENAAQRTVAALNVDFGGVFVFGGADGTTPPVTAATLEEIAATPLSSLFNEGDRLNLAVEEGVFIDGGPRASDAASGLFAEFQTFAEAQEALGPFSGNLTDEQRAFLVDAASRLGAISDALIQEQGLSALAQGQAADAVERNARARDLAEIVAADIEDVDIAEALSLLNQDQLAIQASAQALAQATQLSLLNFI